MEFPGGKAGKATYDNSARCAEVLIEYDAREKPNCLEYKDGRMRRTDEDARLVLLLLLLRCNVKVVIYMCMI